TPGRIEAHPLHEEFAELQLRLHRVVVLLVAPARWSLGLAHPLNHGNERLAHLGEDRLEPRGAHPRLVAIQECVIALALMADRIGLLAPKLEQGAEVRRETGEILGLPRLLPRLHRHRLLAGESLHQRERNPFRPATLARQVGDHSPLGIREGGLLLGPGDQLAEPGLEQALMGERLQRGELRRAEGTPSLRHVGFLIPGEKARDLREIAKLTHPLQKLVPMGEVHLSSSRNEPPSYHVLSYCSRRIPKGSRYRTKGRGLRLAIRRASTDLSEIRPGPAIIIPAAIAISAKLYSKPPFAESYPFLL